MPSSKYHTSFVKGIENNPNWRLVYFDNKHKLFVDVTTPQGKELSEGIMDGQTIYPDEYSKNLIITHNAFLFEVGKAAKQQGLNAAIKAFESNPSPVSMQRVLFATKFEELRPRINNFCKDYVKDFTKNKNLYAEQDGYVNRLLAALFAYSHLEKIAKRQGQEKETKLYATKNQEYKSERQDVIKSKRW
jgi:hypothetical protein